MAKANLIDDFSHLKAGFLICPAPPEDPKFHPENGAFAVREQGSQHEFRSSIQPPAHPGGQPRRDGNSAALAEAARRGAETAGISAELLFMDDHIKHFLTDLRHAPAPDDGYDELFLRHFLPARGVLFCTPIYWYGMSAQTKAFFDRSFSHYAGSGNGPEDVNPHAGQAAGAGRGVRGNLSGRGAGHRAPDPGIRALHAFGLRRLRAWRRQQPGARSRPIRASRCSPRRHGAPNSSRANTRTTG